MVDTQNNLDCHIEVLNAIRVMVLAAAPAPGAGNVVLVLLLIAACPRLLSLSGSQDCQSHGALNFRALLAAVLSSDDVPASFQRASVAAHG